MKKPLVTAILVASLAAGVAIAHPLAGPYDTRGECERDFVDFNKGERLRLDDEETTIGDTQGEIHTKFQCQYHEGDDPPYDRGAGWYFTNLQ